MDIFLAQHSGELLILVLAALLLTALLILVPQALRTFHHTRELQHAENMRALEQGQRVPPPDAVARAAGRTATLVPIVAIGAASTVTCFLVSFKSEQIFSVALAIWCVAGVLSLFAITGGITLMARVAHLASEEDEEQARMKDL
jgi:hypothetical protein